MRVLWVGRWQVRLRVLRVGGWEVRLRRVVWDLILAIARSVAPTTERVAPVVLLLRGCWSVLIGGMRRDTRSGQQGCVVIDLGVESPRSLIRLLRLRDIVGIGRRASNPWRLSGTDVIRVAWILLVRGIVIYQTKCQPIASMRQSDETHRKCHPGYVRNLGWDTHRALGTVR